MRLVACRHRGEVPVALNVVDIVIITLVGALAVLGLRRGFFLGALDLVGVALALIVAGLYYHRLVDPIAARGLSRSTAAILAFAALNIATLAVMSLLTRILFLPLRRLPWPTPIRWADGLLGLVPGAIKGLAIAAVLVLPLSFLQRPPQLSQEIRASRFARPLVTLGLDALYTAIDRYDVNLADFAVITSRPAEEGVELPFTVTVGLDPNPEAEAEMLRLVNAERAAAGLAPVELDSALTQAARAHSEEMFRLGYFSHLSPVSGDPGDRLDAAGIHYLVSGENLAYAPSVTIAHQNLMNSPGHRAIILDPTFTRLGIGIIHGDHRGLMISQEFAT